METQHGVVSGFGHRWRIGADIVLHGESYSILPTTTENMKIEACITTVIQCCHKPFSQWQRSFHLKAALPLAERLMMTASDQHSVTGLLESSFAIATVVQFKLNGLLNKYSCHSQKTFSNTYSEKKWFFFIINEACLKLVWFPVR